VVDAVNTQLILLDLFGSCQEFVGGTRRHQAAPWRAVSGHLEAKYIHTSGTLRQNWQRAKELATIGRHIKRYSVS
jgi:hypothetical protein